MGMEDFKIHLADVLVADREPERGEFVQLFCCACET
jgi:hypothetical protein